MPGEKEGGRVCKQGPAVRREGQPRSQFMLLGTLTTLLALMLPMLSQRFAPSIGECPSLEGRDAVPTSVHDLRPDDFKVVMGLGDSVMAGFGARLLTMLEAQLINEYRGISFAMGGDPHSVTVPNFLRHYRADLVGASRGTHLVELCHGSWCPPDEVAYRPASDRFNAAQTGAMSGNLGMEAKYLLQQVRHHPAVNVAQDWKLLTVFIGVNDVCQVACRNDTAGVADAFESKVLLNLERIRERLPRTLVVLMELPDASQVHWFANRHTRCLMSQPFIMMECPCAMGSEDARWDMRLLTADYNGRLQRVAAKMNRLVAALQPDRALQDFAVVTLPFMRDTDLREDVPQHFMSKLDCFHPSLAAHQAMAAAYWRSLFQPHAQKATRLTDASGVFCPGEADRIVTF